MSHPHLRALISRVRARESFRFTSRSGGLVGSFMVGVVHVGGIWRLRFDPLDKDGWRFHWIATANRMTKPVIGRGSAE